MKVRPALLLALLLYVTLDLALPAMPGAFVFEAADSVESTRARARLAVEAVILPVPVGDGLVLSRVPLEGRDRLTLAERVERERGSVLVWRPRALHDPAPPSEDPH